MKSLGLRVCLLGLAATVFVSFAGEPSCHGQWGYFGRGTTASRGAFRYRGPVLSVEIGSPYSGSAGAFNSSPYGSSFRPSYFDQYRMDDSAFYSTPSVYDRYRGVQPSQAELDRERFYHDLDRTHRYTTREERYANDFRDAYTPPAAMVDRYRYPCVAGTSIPVAPLPIPGLSIGRDESRYQGYVADDDVAVALRAAANRLQRSLSQKSDGYVWIRQLQPDRIVRAIDRAEHPGALSELVTSYEGIAESPRLVLISQAEGFQDVRRLLAQYVTLQSAYPSAETFESSPWPQETIISDEAIGESVVERDHVDLNPPSISIPTELPPPSTSPAMQELPGDADFELLPAPAATRAE